MERVIKGWVAANGDGSLHFFSAKPERIVRVSPGHSSSSWKKSVLFSESMKIPKRFFPNLSWADDPISVKIKIEKQ